MKNERRNGIKRIASLVAVMILMLALLAGCGTPGLKSRYELDVVDHTSDFYINDFAGVFTEEQKNQLMENAVGFDENSSGIQVVITTVESLNSAVLGYDYVVEDAEGNRVEDAQKPSTTPKFTIEEVAYSMYAEYAIGQDDMGILILFSTGDREVRIETGRQMQFYITDSLSGRLLDDYGMEYFREDKFAEGLISLQEGVISEIQAKVPSDWHANIEASKETEEPENATNATTGVVAGDSNVNSDENVTDDKIQEKDPAKGLLWGLFGSIAAAFAAIGAFIRQIFKGKSEREAERKAMEKAQQEEFNSLRANFQRELSEKDRKHDAEVAKLKEDYRRLVQVRDTAVQELNHEIDTANGKISTLTSQLEEMTDKYTRAQQLHPEFNFDEEVHEMIENEYKEAALEVDTKLAEVLNTPASKDNEDIFKKALSFYDSTPNEVKKYVTSSREAIKNLYDEAVALRKEFERIEQEKRDRAAANKAYESIKATLNANPIGNYRTYAALTTALCLFTALSKGEKNFFPDCKLISEVERLQRTAEIDHDNYTKANDAQGEVEYIIGNMYSADEDDRDKLARAMRFYRNLTSAQQAYFSEELLRKLKKLINEADEDHRRQERRREDERRRRDEERRRQQAMRSSSYSSHRSSSFGGHGGRPSGGGASRRF